MKSLKRNTAASAVLALVALSGHAVTLVGLTSSNEITRFDTTNIGAATSANITGLAANDRFVGIDLRPGDNKIYGVTLSNKIYTVDEFTGATTFVAALSMNVISATLGYGIDFNPSADFTGAASLRLISSAGSNFAINPLTGVVGNAASVIPTGISAVAYSNSNPLPTSAPTSTELYYIDTDADVLRVATTGFNAPTITTIGPLGVDALRANGFELLGNGMAYAGLNTDAGTSLVTGIYGINLMTGAATLIGSYNGTLSGLTSSVTAVPEPGTYALFAAGLLAVGSLVRRRRAG